MDEREKIEQWYNELVNTDISLNKFRVKHHTSKNYIKKQILKYGFDYSKITNKKNANISKARTQNVETLYDHDTLSQIKSLLQTEYYSDVVKQYPILNTHKRAWQRFFKKYNIQLKKKTPSQLTAESMHQAYVEWTRQNKDEVLALLKQNKSILEISHLLFNDLKTNYLQYFVKDYYPQYNPQLDHIYTYTLKYGKEQVNKVLKEHNGQLNVMFFQNVRDKAASQMRATYALRKEAVYNEHINEAELKLKIIEQQLTYHYFIRTIKQQKSHTIWRAYQKFFEQHPNYAIFQKKRIGLQLDIPINDRFNYNKQPQLTKLLDQLVIKYPKIIKDWPTLWQKNTNLYYTFIVNYLYNVRHSSKYLNDFLRDYQTPVFTGQQLLDILGNGGYQSVSSASKNLMRTKYFKLFNNHLKLRKRYYESFTGNLQLYWQEMELLQKQNIKTSWFTVNNWNGWKHLIKDTLHLHCNDFDTIQKLIEGLYYDKTGQFLHIKSDYSTYERQIADILDEFNVDYYHNTQTIISPKELDFYLPQHKMAIEVNPTYTHNADKDADFGNEKKPTLKKAPYYHQHKYKACKNHKKKQIKNGREELVDDPIELISLFEKDMIEPTWSNFTKPFIIFKIMGADKVYYARQVKLVNISQNKIQKHEAINFIKKYHEQGHVQAKYYYAYYNKSNELIGVASFSENKNYKSQLELKRMVFLPNIQIIFALSQLVKHVFKDYPQYFGILSYSNNNIGDGRAYAKAGFTCVRETKPTLKYVAISNANDNYSWSIATPWSAAKIKGVIAGKLGHTANMTQEQINNYILNDMPHREDGQKGYVRVYDTGNKLWKINRSDVIK